MKKTAIENSRDCRERQVRTPARVFSRRESGQALVELAFTLPLLALLLLGAGEFARLAYAAIETSNAARAGVQYGAQNHVTASDFAGMQIAATDDGTDVPQIVATATHFCGCANGTVSTCASGDCTGSRIIEYVQVNTTATVDPLIHVPGLPTTFTLNGQAIMRVWQ
ncbi:MAG: TadE/TadG family type IV pilus assembly protein [Acidobacteriaceae bacterium]